jgi:uncharacterized small protein (DUF1192 family)
MTEEKETAIVPVEQRTIDFHGDELVAVQDAAGTVWVPVRRLCDAIGVTVRGQLARIERDPVMRAELRSVYVTYTDGRQFEMACLPLKYVRAWLFGLNADRVKPDIRDKLIAYQREVIEIIDRAFAPTAAGLSANRSQALAMRDLAHRQAELAQQQAAIWDQVVAEQARLDAVQELTEDHEGAIRELERRMDLLQQELAQVQAELHQRLAAASDQIHLLPAPREAPISPDQKAAIKALVDDVVAAALAKGIRLGQGRNDYPAVWDAFKRRFDLARYDELPTARHDEALAWLKAWKDRIG